MKSTASEKTGGRNQAEGFVDTTFALRGDWASSGYWAFVIRNFLLAFRPSDPCRLWISVDRWVLSIDDVVCLIAPLTASFGNGTFATILLEDDPAVGPPGERVLEIPIGPQMAQWSVDHFRSLASGIEKAR